MGREMLDEHRLRRLIDVGRGLVAQLDLERVLNEVVEVARELTDARYVVLSIDPDRPQLEPATDEVIEIPIVGRGEAYGSLRLADKESGGFDAADEEAATILAEWVGAAIANIRLHARSKEERLRQSLMAAERERARWARELHDSILQGMGSRRVLLSAALKSGDPQRLISAVEEGLGDVVRDIDDLRRLITELRPATLDQLGLVAALEDLAERIGHSAEIELACELRIGAARLDPELETVVYRLAQEALNNVAKHAEASRARLRVGRAEDRLDLLVADDGCGFDPAARHGGFGLVGMYERVELVGGDLRIESSAGAGTKVTASVPLPAPRPGSGFDQAAGERALD